MMQQFSFTPPNVGEGEFEIAKALANRLLPPKDFDLKAERKRLAKMQMKAKEALEEVIDKRVRNKFALEALQNFAAWAEKTPYKLQRPGPSKWSELRGARDLDLLVAMQSDKPDLSRFFAEEPQVFLVEHDWASAFKNATGIEADDHYQLPYPRCAFEFEISGLRIIAICLQEEDGYHAGIMCFDATKTWLIGMPGSFVAAPDPERSDKLYATNVMVRDNIKALCIALDAGVAEHSVVRGQHLRNSQGQELRIGNSYRVVSLARQTSRAAPLPGNADPKRHVKMHFRRGHWRHYQTHKTWIKWMLVGDPDLGFIDKEYRA